MKPTLEEVAPLAGVSRSTVSRVINEHPSVSPETRQRVWKTIHGFKAVEMLLNLLEGGTAAKAAREVGTAAGAVIRRLGLEGTDVEVILAGSVFKGKGPLLLDTVTQSVHRVAPRAEVRLPELEPVVGAVFLALEELGIKPDERIHANVHSTLPEQLKIGGGPW